MLCHKITLKGTFDSDTIKLEKTLEQYYDNEKFVLCQIWVNDGVSADPIYKYVNEHKNIEAHFIEPQKKAFELLVENYNEIKDEKRTFYYNYALSNKNEPIKLYINTAVNGTDGHSSLLVRDLDILNKIMNWLKG